MSPGRAYSVEDLRAAARRRLPRIAFEYLEGGAEEGLSLRANREAFDAIRLVPRTLVDVSRRSQSVSVFGRRWAAPFGVAPIGAAGLFRRDAESALARAARSANVPFVLSTHSFLSLEEVARATGAPPWFQLYLHRERAGTEKAVQCAADAGCEALVVTTDVPVGGNREYNARNGFGVPVRLSLRMLLDGLLHPGWLTDVYFRGILGRALGEWGTRRDFHTWDDLAWLRGLWKGKLVVKGVLTVEDAQLAARHGADAVWVSNHGGRQLDGAPASLEALPQIAAAVGDEVAVIVDGGIRRGSDIVKALALGADMVFVGRSVAYGVAMGGEAGARRALQILESEIDRVLALLGCESVAMLGPRHLRLASDASGKPGLMPVSQRAGGGGAGAVRS